MDPSKMLGPISVKIKKKKSKVEVMKDKMQEGWGGGTVLD